MKTTKLGLCRVLLFSACLLDTLRADVYLHNPRGSNNRLNENTAARANANRMFDSQNNNKGGYNVGSLYYYAGSKLSIEWTNQHSCQNPNNHCELIIQYLCDDQVRDGSTTKTIPDDFSECRNAKCDTDFYYGRHEPYLHYVTCKMRERNKGLFTADQDLKEDFATHTRQNPGGTRRGYECAEERDYYPYWQPTPWKDIVVLTNNVYRCPYYQEESENVKARWTCLLPSYLLLLKKIEGLIIPNNKKDCEKFRWPKNSSNDLGAKWIQMPAHGLPAPECRETEFTRDNHLGNGLSGSPNVYNWTVPDLPHDQCVLRIRYNISTNDYNGWNTDEAANKKKNNEASLDLSARYRFSDQEAAKARGYVFKNNPEIKLFDDADFKLRLAINTAQYGRTFQDRSHTFAIRQRPENLKTATIHNVNVRGKRGNIVQVYPAVEYDFVPNTVELAVGDYVHFQWTGSNTNPKNFDGEGLAGTDRSNAVLLSAQVYPEGTYRKTQICSHYGNNYPAHLDNATFLGLLKKDRINLAFVENNQLGGEMSLLNDAGTYFDLGLRQVTQPGTYHYMCTRNNNFSNRDQKGEIKSLLSIIHYKALGVSGGEIMVPKKASLTVGKGIFKELRFLKMEVWKSEVGETRLKAVGKKLPTDQPFASNFVNVEPEDLSVTGKTAKLRVNLFEDYSDVTVYRGNKNFTFWSTVTANIKNRVAEMHIYKGGIYVATYKKKLLTVPIIAGISVSAIVAIITMGGLIAYCWKSNLSASFSKKVSRSLLTEI